MAIHMNLLKLFALSLGLILPLEYEAFSQMKRNLCPNPGGQNIWIRDKTNPNNYREGKPRKLVEINAKEKKVTYCVGDHLAEEDLNSLRDISFVPPGVIISNTATSPTAPPNSQTVIADENAGFPATINSTTDLPHPTLSGTVTLRMTLYENGTVDQIQVVSSTNTALEALALKEAKELKFTPAIYNGNWTNVRKQIVFTFYTTNGQKITPTVESSNSTFENRQINSRPQLPSFKVLSPSKGDKVRQTAVLRWEAVPNTLNYKIELFCGFSREDCSPGRVPGSQTSYTMTFPGEVPIKWRVVAELKNGKNAYSDWGYFGYKK